MPTDIHGHVAPGFERVAEVFAANFERDDGLAEVGASVAAYKDETLVVDLWAGYRDPDRRTPWTADTLTNVWSTTKGITAICVATLVDRGLIDYAAPLARYWPEFAQNGKAGITVSQALSHVAGLPGFAEPTTLEDFYDWETVTARLARQAPMWSPGTKTSYHASTFGFLGGELVRRVTGKSIGVFLAEEIAGPLGADVHIGLPLADEARVAEVIEPRIYMPFDPDSMAPEAVMAVTNPDMSPTMPNSRAWRAAELPALNGMATAKGLARVFAVLANEGTFDGVRIMSPQGVAALDTVQTTQVDLLLGIAPNWRNGLVDNQTGLYGPRPNVIGHSGWGGAFGCADRIEHVAIGYTLNQLGFAIIGDPRATALCDAVYACL